MWERQDILYGYSGESPIQTTAGLFFGLYVTVIVILGTDTASAQQNVRENKPLNILVVDDEVLLTELTAEILKTAGHEVTTASCAEQALEILASGQSIDVLISDVMMPAINGLELAEKVRKTYPHIKIVLVSGYSELSGLEESAAQYHDIHLDKPVSSTRLLNTLAEL